MVADVRNQGPPLSSFGDPRHYDREANDTGINMSWGFKDFVDLATAVGTCSAVLVALWVAGRAQRRTEYEKSEVARLVASEISYRLVQMVRELQQLDELFAAEDADPEDFRKNLVHARTYAHQDMQLFRRETLVALIPLPNETAHRIARATDILRLIRHDLDRRESTIREGSPQMVTSIHKRVRGLVREAHEQLVAASTACVAAARLQAPELAQMPPV